MGSERTTPVVLINAGVIAAAAFLTGFFIAGEQDPVYLLMLLAIPVAVFLIIDRVKRSHRQIAFFFEAVRNEDSSLKFPETVKQRSLRRLYKSLNDLNAKITEIKLKNAYLEKYYQTFIRQAETGLLSLNGSNEVEIMNEKAFEYAGIAPYTPLHLVPSRNPGLFEILFQVRPGEALTYKRLSGDSPVDLLIHSREISFGEKVTRVISLQDIHPELDEKELDSWQKLIRVLTHEIMNSIAPVVSLTGTLRQFFIRSGKPVLPTDIDRETIENVILGLDTIEERGKGLVNFVDNYRKLTRIPQPEFAVFRVKEWIENIHLLEKARLEKLDIGYEAIIDPKVGEITGDKRLLTQVVINILNNAMEALEEVPQERKIRISVESSRQNRPLIRIANNGPAISPDILEKIFIPFFTTREEGSGIGLSLSRQIMRLHHGYIHAESGEGQTSFVLTF